MKTTILYGITMTNWLRLLWRNSFRIDPGYLHRAAALTGGSVLNSVLGMVESVLYSKEIASVTVDPPPTFIIGHWRSGTTLLQTVLSQDTQFATPNTFQVIFPHTFLTTELIGTKLLAPFVPRTRVEGDMPLHLAGPKEEEIALSISSGCSPYLGVIFPRHETQYRKYLTLRGISPADLERWKSSLRWFVKKLTVKYRRPLLLKSPPHTARIRVLLDMFPEARFVHICRNPYRVFHSTRRMYAAWYRQSAFLQHPTLNGMDDRILEQYMTMYDAFFNDVALIPKRRLCTLKFEDLTRDPIGGLAEIYRSLDLPGFAAAEPKFAEYFAETSDYRQARHPELDEDTRETIASRWSRNFAAWDYPT